MKPEHTKNIKKFIKKYKSVLKLPFMNKFSGEPSAEAVGKPMVEILPSIDRISEEDTTGIAKLAAKYDPTAKVSGGFGKSPIVTILNSGNKKEAALTGEVKSDGPETIVRTLSGGSDSVIPYSYLKPTDTPRAMFSDNKLISTPEKSNSVIPYSYLKPTDTPRVMSSTNKLISLPKTDVKKLVDLSLTNQITNKIIKTKNNEYTLKIPEYGIGKNIISGLMSVVKAAKPAVKNAAKNFGTIGDKLNPLTDALKSAKKMGMSLLSQAQRDESSSTPSVSSSPPTPPVVSNEYPAQAVKGNPASAAAAAAPAAAAPTASATPAAAAPTPAAATPAAATPVAAAPVAAAPTPAAATPVAAAPTPAAATPAAATPAAAAPAAAAPVAASGSISTATGPAKGSETKIESNFDNGVGSDPQQAQAAAEQTLNTAEIPEERGAGAARGIEGIVDAVTTVAQVALTVGTGGVGGAAMGALKGVGAMAGGASKVAGGLGKVSKLAGAMPGGGGGEGGGGGGGGIGVPGGGGGGGGGIGSMLGGIVGGGGALAAVGGIAAGVGGVAAGLGIAVGGLAGAYATVGGKLIDAVFGGNDKKESPVSVSTDSRSNSTVINSVSNQYDVYRKTADDSFMLPNYRREYG